MDDPIKRKIAALMKMTRGAGCSEAEALAAAEKAAALMAEHGLSAADVEFTAGRAKAKTMGKGRRDRTWAALAFCTNTALLYSEGQAQFVGRGPGPEIAAYLYTVLDRAMDRALAAYKASANYRRRKSLKSRRGAADDFIDAMGLRLREALHTLFQGTMSRDERHAALAARDRFCPAARPVSGKAPALARNRVAFGLGDAAGLQVRLAHGMAGGSTTLLVGRVS